MQCIHKKYRLWQRLCCTFMVLAFTFNTILPSTGVSAQTVLSLPAPGTMVPLSPGFNPVLIKGVHIHPSNPLKLDFVIDRGNTNLTAEEFKAESTKLIKYFLASLTTPEEEMWVNLSPYEKDRIIPEHFGQTEMGRDLLAQDYLLKQLSASLLHPDEKLGQEFWKKIRAQSKEKFGTAEMPADIFNKIWIVPKEAFVYEHTKGAFVVESRLKVMMEEDYLALSKSTRDVRSKTQDVTSDTSDVSHLTSNIIRTTILPEIEREVNEGATFANLRQIYNALILATWYKKKLMAGTDRDRSLLGKKYVDQNKTNGINLEDKTINQKIYDQYITAFKKGVYNFIKEDVDPSTQQTIPRKYFSGGAALQVSKTSITATSDELNPAERIKLNTAVQSVDGAMVTVAIKQTPESAPIGRRFKIMINQDTTLGAVAEALFLSEKDSIDINGVPQDFFDYKDTTPIEANTPILIELHDQTVGLDHEQATKQKIKELIEAFLTEETDDHGSIEATVTEEVLTVQSPVSAHDSDRVALFSVSIGRRVNVQDVIRVLGVGIDNISVDGKGVTEDSDFNTTSGVSTTDGDRMAFRAVPEIEANTTFSLVVSKDKLDGGLKVGPNQEPATVKNITKLLQEMWSDADITVIANSTDQAMLVGSKKIRIEVDPRLGYEFRENIERLFKSKEVFHLLVAEALGLENVGVEYRLERFSGARKTGEVFVLTQEDIESGQFFPSWSEGNIKIVIKGELHGKEIRIEFVEDTLGKLYVRPLFLWQKDQRRATKTISEEKIVQTLISALEADIRTENKWKGAKDTYQKSSTDKRLEVFSSEMRLTLKKIGEPGSEEVTRVIRFGDPNIIHPKRIVRLQGQTMRYHFKYAEVIEIYVSPIASSEIEKALDGNPEIEFVYQQPGLSRPIEEKHLVVFKNIDDLVGQKESNPKVTTDEDQAMLTAEAVDSIAQLGELREELRDHIHAEIQVADTRKDADLEPYEDWYRRRNTGTSMTELLSALRKNVIQTAIRFGRVEALINSLHRAREGDVHERIAVREKAEIFDFDAGRFQSKRRKEYAPRELDKLGYSATRMEELFNEIEAHLTYLQELVEGMTLSLVVMPDRQGRHTAQMGFSIIDYLREEVSVSATLELPGTTAEELTEAFQRLYPEFESFIVVPDGTTWLVVDRGVLPYLEHQPKPKLKLINNGEVTIRFLPELITFSDRQHGPLPDFSNKWAPTLTIFLNELKEQVPLIHKKIMDGKIVLAHNGRRISNFKAPVRFKSGDEITLMPPLLIPVIEKDAAMAAEDNVVLGAATEEEDVIHRVGSFVTSQYGLSSFGEATLKNYLRGIFDLDDAAQQLIEVDTQIFPDVESAKDVLIVAWFMAKFNLPNFLFEAILESFNTFRRENKISHTKTLVMQILKENLPRTEGQWFPDESKDGAIERVAAELSPELGLKESEIKNYLEEAFGLEDIVPSAVSKIGIGKDAFDTRYVTCVLLAGKIAVKYRLGKKVRLAIQLLLFAPQVPFSREAMLHALNIDDKVVQKIIAEIDSMVALFSLASDQAMAAERFDDDQPREGELPVALVVFSDEYGRSAWRRGYPVTYYLGEDERSSASMEIPGTTARELTEEFHRRYPSLRDVKIEKIDGTWLAVGGDETYSRDNAKKKPQETKTSSGQIVRFLPELNTFHDRHIAADLSKRWTPTLTVLLRHLKKDAPGVYKRIRNEEIILAHNGRRITDLTIPLDFEEGDEITLLPLLIFPPSVSEGRQGISMLMPQDLEDPKKVEQFFSAYAGLTPEERAHIDQIHQGEEEREILATYLLSARMPEKEAVSTMMDIGYDRGMAERFVKKVRTSDQAMVTHTIMPGDTISTILRQYAIDEMDLILANSTQQDGYLTVDGARVLSNRLKKFVGLKLHIPVQNVIEIRPLDGKGEILSAAELQELVVEVVSGAATEDREISRRVIEQITERYGLSFESESAMRNYLDGIPGFDLDSVAHRLVEKDEQIFETIENAKDILIAAWLITKLELDASDESFRGIKDQLRTDRTKSELTHQQILALHIRRLEDVKKGKELSPREKYLSLLMLLYMETHGASGHSDKTESEDEAIERIATEIINDSQISEQFDRTVLEDYFRESRKLEDIVPLFLEANTIVPTARDVANVLFTGKTAVKYRLSKRGRCTVEVILAIDVTASVEIKELLRDGRIKRRYFKKIIQDIALQRERFHGLLDTEVDSDQAMTARKNIPGVKIKEPLAEAEVRRTIIPNWKEAAWSKSVREQDREDISNLLARILWDSEFKKKIQLNAIQLPKDSVTVKEINTGPGAWDITVDYPENILLVMERRRRPPIVTYTEFHPGISEHGFQSSGFQSKGTRILSVPIKVETAQDNAMINEVIGKKNPGGIDLNPTRVEMDIKKEGRGVQIPITPRHMENIQINGLTPVIINITPITNLPLLIGLMDETEEDHSKTSHIPLSPADRKI